MRTFARRCVRTAVWVVLALLIATDPACSCAENGHVEPTLVVAREADTVVNCVCNLTFAYDKCSDNRCDVHLALPVCLPPELQARLATLPDAGAGDLGLHLDGRAKLVDDYCRDAMTNVVYHMVKVITGSWCEYKAPYAPDGGVGESVRCFAYPFDEAAGGSATALDDGTCKTSCAPVPCDYDTNCGGSVKDVDGTIHPERCDCSIITNYDCPGDPASDLPTALFCRPPEGSLQKNR